MKRSEAIKTILDTLSEQDIALFTTGMISREAFAIKDRDFNFYMIGSMGLLSSFGLGLALQLPERRIVIVEGDGSFLMCLGTAPLIGAEQPKNLLHIVLDNQAYESTGGQPTISRHVNLKRLAESSGYKNTFFAQTREDLESILKAPIRKGPTFLHVQVELSRMQQIPRIALAPEELRDRLRAHIQDR